MTSGDFSLCKEDVDGLSVGVRYDMSKFFCSTDALKCSTWEPFGYSFGRIARRLSWILQISDTLRREIHVCRFDFAGFLRAMP